MNEMSRLDDQTRVIAALGDPALHGGRTVQRVDTHAACVFLAGDRAWKLKRAVRLPYLDFSTLDRREDACRAEMALNRRTAPEIYLGVGALVALPDGRLALVEQADRCPAGSVVLDWLVAMRRFDQDRLLESVAAAGGLDVDMMRDLGSAIATFHEEAEPDTETGGADAMARIAAGNTDRLRSFPELFAADRVAWLDRQTRARLEGLAPLMDRRRDAGYVRHCHGDLHLRNIVLLDGRPVLFDCLEFDPAMATIDVLYDLAFLLMDLEHRGLRRMANVVFNRYLGMTGDLAGLALLPLFLSIRAVIRAHVDAEAARRHPDAAGATALQGAAITYFDLAISLLQPPPPRLVAIGGLSGTGKTTLARWLAPEIGPCPGAVILRSDVLRKRLLGVDPLTRLAPEGYSEAVTRRVYGEMAGRAGLALESRHGVICDAVYARPEQRQDAESIAAAAGAAFTGLWLVADQETQAARVGERHGDASDATLDILRRQAAFDLGEMRWDIIPANGPPAEVAAIARRYLR